MDTKKFLIIVFILGVAVRFIFFGTGFIFSGSDFVFNYGDAEGYATIARNIAEGNGFSWDKNPPYLPNGNRTPGYPLFLALSYILTGGFLLAIFIQIVL